MKNLFYQLTLATGLTLCGYTAFSSPQIGHAYEDTFKLTTAAVISCELSVEGIVQRAEADVVKTELLKSVAQSQKACSTISSSTEGQIECAKNIADIPKVPFGMYNDTPLFFGSQKAPQIAVSNGKVVLSPGNTISVYNVKPMRAPRIDNFKDFVAVANPSSDVFVHHNVYLRDQSLELYDNFKSFLVENRLIGHQFRASNGKLDVTFNSPVVDFKANNPYKVRAGIARLTCELK